MADYSSGIGSGILQFIGTVMGLIMQNKLNDENLQTQKDLQESQNQFNAEQAELSNQRSINNYLQFESPQAKIQQYKEAGLSPSYLTSGTGLSGTLRTAPQATAANVTPYYKDNTMSLMLDNSVSKIAQVIKTIAEAKNEEADTELKGAEYEQVLTNIEKTKTEINNIIQDTHNKELIATQTELQNSLLKIENIYKEQEKQATINQINEQNNKLIEEVKNLQIDNSKKEEILDNEIKLQLQTLTKAWWETEVIKKQKDLVDSETKLNKAKEALTWLQKDEVEKQILNIISDTNLKDANTKAQALENYYKEHSYGMGNNGMVASLLRPFFECTVQTLDGLPQELKKVQDNLHGDSLYKR